MLRNSNIGHWIGLGIAIAGGLALWGLYRLTSDFWYNMVWQFL